MNQQAWNEQKTLAFSKTFFVISDMLIQMVWLVHHNLKDQLVGMETTLCGIFCPPFYFVSGKLDTQGSLLEKPRETIISQYSSTAILV